MKCEICSYEASTLKQLGYHLAQKHRITDVVAKGYYDTHIKSDDEGICLISNEPTKWLGFSRGYEKYASSILNRCRSSNSVYYWIIKKGLTRTEAEACVREEQQRRSKRVRNRCPFPNTIGYWTQRGYTNEEAKIRVGHIQAERSKKNTNRRALREIWFEKYDFETATKRYNEWKLKLKERSAARTTNGNTSQLATKLFGTLDLFGFPGRHTKNELALFDTAWNKYWKYDFCYDKNIIEVHGDYWHCNPDIYNEHMVVRGGQSANVIWKNDARKIECAHYYGYKVLTLWESEIRQDIKKVLQKCLTYLQNMN